MTTNAIDRRKVIIASDSRWSLVENDHLIYVDDTGFEKIATRPFSAMICAGDGVLIEAWRNWYLARQLLVANLPPTERPFQDGQVSIDVTLVAEDGQILFIKGVYITLDEHALFAGSGAAPAYECFEVNRSATLSVESASKVDPQTGGAIKFVDLQLRKHNLSQPGRTLKDANQELLARGMAMDLTTKKVIPMRDYLATATQQKGNFQAGDSGLSAPTGKNCRPWTSADKERLKQAVESLIELETKSR